MVQNKSAPLLLVNDLVGQGRVALSVMVPILTHLGFDTVSLPTALVSNTFDRKDYARQDTGAYVADSLAVWQRLDLSFSAVCTGFLADPAQGEAVLNYTARRRKDGLKLFVDPIMADHGALYHGLSHAIVPLMRTMAAQADLIVPNVTEACLLADVEYHESFSQDEISALLARLHDLGAARVVISGVPLTTGHTVVVSEGPEVLPDTIPYQPVALRVIGTGDAFSALLYGRYLAHGDLTRAAREAARAMTRMLEAKKNRGDDSRGLPVERYFEVLDAGFTEIR
jgi:pyridoxine kinase